MKLGATAGLRLLPGGKADKILEKVRDFLRASPFQLDEAAGVTILDGGRSRQRPRHPLPLLHGRVVGAHARDGACHVLHGHRSTLPE